MHDARAIAESFDLRALPPQFFANPYPFYAALRTHAPVKRLPDGSVFLTRYADIEAVYKDNANFSSDKQVEFAPKFGDSPLYEHHTTSLVFNDPPLHTRVRRIISGALTPRAISALEPDLVTLIDALLDRAATRISIDAIEDFAAAIPIEVIGNLLGVPHEDRGPLRGWSLAILGALEPVLSAERAAAGNAAVVEFIAYLETLVAARRKKLGDPDRDVLSRLIIGEANGEKLFERELLHNCIFLLNAGHETTTNLIGNAIALLIEWSDQRARLIVNPDLMRLGVEEVLRFESSNQLGNRITLGEAEIAGVKLAPRTPVHIAIGGANRDPQRFANPDRFDVAREPNRHLAFITGPHQCVGMALARLEGRVALSRFLARFPNFRSAADPVRGGRVRFRGFASLPIILG